ncbi:MULTISPECIES: response regulator [unclassified Bradyrhizobium]|uniref:response regulator n=1 Tax=unclassified Bradyrhizobium TaxID=2631580 RepID=UPI001FFB955E|nr:MULTISPECIES: response regulator [unclassified Bradyrhizobium]MCK1277668.1 response regulator [Bradyrhizobium sp. 61]MCK1445686.1 response regulator [Bradyrhizobium sp. 48]MCK1465394.1 response regulator [Bradyrhizobium sp. 2]
MGSTGKLRVLIIEDEALVAFFIEDMLTDMGHEVGAVVSRMQEALDLAKTGTFDLAIVDVNLDGEPSYPIAETLRKRGIPFIFATGYGSKGLDPTFADAPVVAKPFTMADLQRLLPMLPKARPLAPASGSS